MCDCGTGLGMRQGEVFGFSPDDVDWLGTGRLVHVRRQLKVVRGVAVFAPPKGGRERDIPLPGSVQLTLAAHLQEFPAAAVTLPWREPDGKAVTVRLMFLSEKGHPLRSSNFDRHVWHPAREKAGMAVSEGNGFHALRHYFASRLLAGGCDIRTLAEYLGHSDPGFTLRVYTHLMPQAGDRMRNIIDGEASQDHGPGTDSAITPEG
jgi:integrase